jgi:hypothetical protein
MEAKRLVETPIILGGNRIIIPESHNLSSTIENLRIKTAINIFT